MISCFDYFGQFLRLARMGHLKKQCQSGRVKTASKRALASAFGLSDSDTLDASREVAWSREGDTPFVSTCAAAFTTLGYAYK